MPSAAGWAAIRAISEVVVMAIACLELAAIDGNDAVVQAVGGHGTSGRSGGARLECRFIAADSAVVLKSGASQSVNRIIPTLRWRSRSGHRLDCTNFQ